MRYAKCECCGKELHLPDIGGGTESDRDFEGNGWFRVTGLYFCSKTCINKSQSRIKGEKLKIANDAKSGRNKSAFFILCILAWIPSAKYLDLIGVLDSLPTLLYYVLPCLLSIGLPFIAIKINKKIGILFTIVYLGVGYLLKFLA